MSEDLKYRLKQMPTDVWSVREKLALASSVMRSGDQNWVSVSRAIRPFGNPGRPSDWFSQKNCALQYSALLEKVETPRRKRGEREVTETPGDVIVRKLTIERIEELKRIIQEEAVRYRSLKNDLELVRSGQVDSHIKEMWEKLQTEKMAAKEAAAKKAAEELRARELAKAAASRLKKPLPLNLRRVMGMSTSDHEDSTQDSVFDAMNNEDSNQSALSASATPGVSRVLDNVMGDSSAPSSPLSLLLQTAPKPPELQYTQLAQPHSDLPDVSTIAALIDDSVEMKQEPVDICDEAGILDTPDENDIGSVELPMEPNQILDDSLQDAINAAIAVMKDNDGDIKVEELITEFDSPDLQDFDAASSAEAVIHDSEVIISAISVADTPTVEVESVSCQASPVKTSPVIGDTEPPSVVSEVTSVENENVISAQKAASVVEETIEEALSPASSSISTDIGSVQHKSTPSTHKSGRGAKAKQTPKRSSQTRQSEESKESEKSNRPCEVDTSEDEALSTHIHDENTNDVFNTSSVRQKIELSESLPNSPASFSHSDTEDEKAHKIWKKSIMLVWRSAANHKFANVFLHPVTEDIAPGYHSVVHRPMDLSTIKKNIDNGVIRTTAEFQRDMMLMFINAMMYNNVQHDVHKMALSMYNDVMMHIEHFVNTQMMVQAEPKLLRTLRRADAHSDKEEESRKRKTSEVEPQQQPPQQSQQPQQQSTPSGTGSGTAKKRR